MVCAMKTVLSPVIPECEFCPNRQVSDICQIVLPVKENSGIIKRRAMYRSGQFVFYEGHAALGLYILCHGRAKLTRLNRKGQQRLVGIVNSGQLLEKDAFQEHSVHQVTCEILESSQVCLLDRTSFLSFLKEHDQLAFTPARERLAGLLLELGNRFGQQEDAGIRITLHLKREDLAQMVAVTVETVVRLLYDFQNAQLIEVNRRELILVNTNRLAAIAGISPPSR
jgi:CRP-like cAMP-binding protein